MTPEGGEAKRLASGKVRSEVSGTKLLRLDQPPAVLCGGLWISVKTDGVELRRGTWPLSPKSLCIEAFLPPSWAPGVRFFISAESSDVHAAARRLTKDGVMTIHEASENWKQRTLGGQTPSIAVAVRATLKGKPGRAAKGCRIEATALERFIERPDLCQDKEKPSH